MTEEENKEEKAEKAKGTDYTAPKRGRNKGDDAPDKAIEKVVKGAVVVKKPGIGSKLKSIFVATDIRGVMNYVTYEIIIPATRNLIADTAKSAVDRMFYGESRFPRPPGGRGQGIISRYSYNAPVQREREGYRDPRTAPPGPSAGPRRSDMIEFYLASKQEADEVLATMYDVLNVHESVLMSELKTMLDLDSTYTDQLWGWTDLRGSVVRQDRVGWTIDLPKPEPIQ
jgi:hypothetical protein